MGVRTWWNGVLDRVANVLQTDQWVEMGRPAPKPGLRDRVANALRPEP